MKIKHIIHGKATSYPDDKGRPLEVIKYECANDCPYRKHCIRITQPGEANYQGEVFHYWEYNRNPDSPTLNPSIHRLDHGDPPKTLCHHFLRDGAVQCLSDSDSKYSGTNVQLKELEE